MEKVFILNSSPIISLSKAGLNIILEWVAVIDDGAARKCANVYNLNLTGTLGLLLIAYKTGLIRNLQDAIDAIKDAGLYLNDHVINDILQEVDS